MIVTQVGVCPDHKELSDLIIERHACQYGVCPGFGTCRSRLCYGIGMDKDKQYPGQYQKQHERSTAIQLLPDSKVLCMKVSDHVIHSIGIRACQRFCICGKLGSRLLALAIFSSAP